MNSTDSFLEGCDDLMTGQTPKAILQKAYDRISDKAKWTRGAVARNANGGKVRPDSTEAVCWDIEGAVSLACNPYGILPPFFIKLLDGVAEEYGTISSGLLNDHFSHEIVLEALSKAYNRV